ncbi:MAG TPA: flagellar biosynthesis protein FlhF, partial [Steroidobacteraceae bacterium]|nr:flagellar biosynthesis protein FlhF [Steroidobacteraceae bacterium]
MKMKRYVAADMRSALRAIREEQGPDAVILSSRPTSNGVEVCAAVDLELAAGQGTLAEEAALKQLERVALSELQREAQQVAANALRPANQAADEHEELSRAARATDAAELSSSVGEELKSLRGLLEQQLAALAWNDFTRREPLKARALTDLANLGLERALAMEIVEEMPASVRADQAQRLPYALLSRRLKVCPPPHERSGAIALIGPTGSGKTTTLSKLAARYVLEQDAANLIVISADDERLGAHEQLRSLGRLLGVRVESVSSLDEVAARIAALPDRMILIDTPGIVSRDSEAVARYRRWRDKCRALQIMLTLPASAQGGVVDEAVIGFNGVATCCVLTRVDEAVSLGGVLSSLARCKLPVAYCCEGPRIPDDIRPVRAHQLIARAMDLARQAQVCADDDLL